MKNLLFAAILICAGCATGSHIITGTARPLISADGVRIYQSMPANAETIGVVNATFADSGQRATDRAVAELKKQAGLIGANGVVVGNVGSNQGTGNAYLGSATGNTSVSGTAIFVP